MFKSKAFVCGIEIANGFSKKHRKEMYFMSNVAIEKVRDADALPPSLFEQVVVTADKIRQRAFELFQKRGDAGDRSLDDWLQAEREVILSPQSELIEKDGKYRVRVAVPGFDAKDIHVTAIPGALIVEAKAKHKHEKSEGDVYLCEFGQRQLFRRLDLPAPINPDKVTANLEQGILQLTAEKTVDSAHKVKSIAAA
jgi:HSP20 family molecular chaperone IbpA